MEPDVVLPWSVGTVLTPWGQAILGLISCLALPSWTLSLCLSAAILPCAPFTC